MTQEPIAAFVLLGILIGITLMTFGTILIVLNIHYKAALTMAISALVVSFITAVIVLIKCIMLITQ